MYILFLYIIIAVIYIYIYIYILLQKAPETYHFYYLPQNFLTHKKSNSIKILILIIIISQSKFPTKHIFHIQVKINF